MQSDSGARRRLELETHLRRALERNEFEMQYQPQVDLMAGSQVWKRCLCGTAPNSAGSPPSEFIPIAEDTGMILPIGAWVLRQACHQIADGGWQGLRPVPVAVNVSALQFAQPDFVATVADALADDAPVGALELELTESLIMRDADVSAGRMRELRNSVSRSPSTISARDTRR